MPLSRRRSHRRRLLPDRGIRLGLPHASADARRPAGALGRRRAPAGDGGDDATAWSAISTSSAVFKSKDWDFTDVFYSFGVANPGAITVHNYPEFPARAGAARRRGGRPRLDRRHARPRTRRAALQSVPRAAAQEADPRPSTSSPIRCIPACPRSCGASTARPAARDNVDRIDLMVGLFSRSAAGRASASATPRSASSS